MLLLELLTIQISAAPITRLVFHSIACHTMSTPGAMHSEQVNEKRSRLRRRWGFGRGAARRQERISVCGKPMSTGISNIQLADEDDFNRAVR